jgi:hypothetical protein
VDELRPAAGDRLPGFPERIVLVAAAADGADDTAVREDEHLGADPLRRRSERRHDRHERGRLASLERIRHGAEDLSIHEVII